MYFIYDTNQFFSLEPQLLNTVTVSMNKYIRYYIVMIHTYIYIYIYIDMLCMYVCLSVCVRMCVYLTLPVRANTLGKGMNPLSSQLWVK